MSRAAHHQAAETTEELGFRPLAAAVDDLVGLPTRPEGFETVATLFVGEDWRAVEAALRVHAVNRTEPGPAVGCVEYRFHEPPIVRWRVAGWRWRST